MTSVVYLSLCQINLFPYLNIVLSFIFLIISVGVGSLNEIKGTYIYIWTPACGVEIDMLELPSSQTPWEFYRALTSF